MRKQQHFWSFEQTYQKTPDDYVPYQDSFFFYACVDAVRFSSYCEEIGRTIGKTRLNAFSIIIKGWKLKIINFKSILLWIEIMIE